MALACALASAAAAAVAPGVEAGAAQAQAAPAEGLTIEHQPVRCLVAGKYPQVDACIVPADRVARARVYFRPASGSDWYYVEMKHETPCYRGTLPRPAKSLKEVEYYVAATGVDFGGAQTEEYRTRVVPDEKSCSEGPVAPFVTSASVVVGGLAGALPAGFAAAGVAAGASTAAVVAGVVGAGAAGAAIVTGGGGEETTTSTTRPHASTTTTTTNPTTTTTSTTTSTTMPGGCGADSARPEVRFVQPEDNAAVGATIDIEVEARDPGPVANGIRQVRLHAEEQGGPRTAEIAILPGPGPIFRASWALPPCARPQDRWYLLAEAVDGCGRTTVERIRVRRRKDTCAMASGEVAASSRADRATDRREPGLATPGSAPLVWTSELAVPGGQGQVVANGTDVAFPGPGRTDVVFAARPGRNPLEATLVDATGRGGTWRFTVASGAIAPGSLRVVAGEVAALGADTVVFRLRGHPGERVVFTFDVE